MWIYRDPLAKSRRKSFFHMKHATGTLAFIARFVILGLAVAFVISLLWPRSSERLRARFGLASTTTEPAHSARAASAPVSYADAVAAEVTAIVAELGAKGPGDMGKVMGAVKSRLAGKADMAMVSAAVKQALAS